MIFTANHLNDISKTKYNQISTQKPNNTKFT